MSRNVKWNKKLSFDWPGQQASLVALGEMAADMLESRINEGGVDANGKHLPNLSGTGWFISDKSDPRRLSTGENAEPWNTRGSTGEPTQVVDRRGYAAAKVAKGGKPWKGASLTGAMWKSLTIRQQGTAGKIRLKLYFAGSQKTGAGRFRNRDKARLLQYADRASGQGFEPAGKRDFELMTFSQGEKKKLAAFWLSRCRLFRPV